MGPVVIPLEEARFAVFNFEKERSGVRSMAVPSLMNGRKLGLDGKNTEEPAKRRKSSIICSVTGRNWRNNAPERLGACFYGL